MSKPRVFILDGYSEKFRLSIAMDKQIKVIEMEPILDLLAKILSARLDAAPTEHSDAVDDTIAFLREHNYILGESVISASEGQLLEDDWQ